MSTTPQEGNGGNQTEPVKQEVRTVVPQIASTPTDTVVTPTDEAALAGETRAEIDTIYRTGWLAQFLENANQGKPTPAALVLNLLQTAGKMPEDDRKLQARRAILTAILPAGITVNSRPDMHQLIRQMALLGIYPVQFEQGDVHLGVRPDKKQPGRRMLEFEETGIDISRFPISTQPGAPLHDFVWRGEGIVERISPAE